MVALAGACQQIETLEGEVAALREADQRQAEELARLRAGQAEELDRLRAQQAERQAEAQARLEQIRLEVAALRRAEREQAQELASLRTQQTEQQVQAEARLAEARQEVEELRRVERRRTRQLARLQGLDRQVQALEQLRSPQAEAEVQEFAGADEPQAAVEASEPEVPHFPWPPPRASASVVIPAAFIRSSDITGAALGDVAAQIREALDIGGYVERSYYAAPGGFAMVTRLEQINPDGTPKQDEAERWTVQAQPIRSFSLVEYLRALFTAPAGHYRIIVFVVSSQPFAQSDAEVSRSDALAWLREGLNRLPDNIARSPYTDRHTVTALIYEFEQPGRQEALLLLPGNLTGRSHLQRAMLWDAFTP